MDQEAQQSSSGVPGQGLPLRDMGSFVHTSTISDAEIKDHRSTDAVYLSLHVPRHRGHRRGRHRHGHRKPQQASEHSSVEATPPSQLIQFLLGEDDGTDDPEHKIHAIFCEMAELFTHGNEMQWKETARWIKFEEDVEEGGERWSKPHVATLSLHSLFELRSCIQHGTVLLDMDAQYFDQVIDLILDQLVAVNQLEITMKDNVRDVLLQRHRHLNEKHEHSGKINLPIIRSIADIGRKYSLPKELNNHEKANGHDAPQSEHVSLIEHHDDTKHNQKTKLTGVKTMPNFHSAADTDHSPKIDRCATLGSGLKRNQSSGNDLHNHENSSSHKLNLHFMKKIPQDAESANVLVGEVDFLNHQIVAFVRLSQSSCFGDLTEVPVPTKFIFILLGPAGHQNKYHEIGRSIATLMSDEIFHSVAYHARHTEDLLAGIDEFLDQVTVLPPGEWDPSIRIEPPKSVPSQDSRMTSEGKKQLPNGKAVCEEVQESHGADPALQRTGRLFGGLVQDIKRKVPFYMSDFKDALNIQCLASFLFLYFACLTPVITFGGLLGDATNNNLAAFESLLAGAFVGIIYALFSGQPLTILGSTGPVLVFETIVYNFCDARDLDYLSFRWWIGMWTGAMLIAIVAFDLSALVRYITRFTEESFAALISLIFIKEAFAKLIHITHKKPVNFNAGVAAFYDCVCVENTTSPVDTKTDSSILAATMKPVITSVASNLNVTEMGGIVEWHKLSRDECNTHHGLLVGEHCHYVADVFFLSMLLFIGTFTIAYFLKGMKTGRFFPTMVRSLISDFSVVIAIICMILVDAIAGLDTPKLDVPEEFTTTNPNRSWVISPFVEKNPWWLCIVAIIPALLATILLFMDQQITAVIVNRRENKLKKGCGYHLDLLITSLMIMVCSCLGLPWNVAATVLSINHVMSLKKESECTAPGERPKFLGVRENRVTGVLIFLMIGLSVFLTRLLKYIPMPVLYGVFLYMGVSSLKGMQLVNRIMIFFMPIKYQPDYAYLRHVRTFRVHFFTVIQMVCLVLLWVIKTVETISIAFPLMVLGMCFVRKGLDYVFTQNELRWLDDIMPEIHKREKEDKDKQKLTADDQMDALLDPKCSGPNFPGQSSIVNLPLSASNADSFDSTVNITEEMSKTAIWKNLESGNTNEKTSHSHESDSSSKSLSSVDPKTSILKHKKRNNKHKEDKLPTIPSSPVEKDAPRSGGKKGEKSIAFYIDEDEHEKAETPTIVIDPPSSEVRARFFSDDTTKLC